MARSQLEEQTPNLKNVVSVYNPQKHRVWLLGSRTTALNLSCGFLTVSGGWKPGKLLNTLQCTGKHLQQGIVQLKVSLVHTKTCTWMFMTLFTMTKRQKYPKCLLTDEWINKMWYIHTGYSEVKSLSRVWLFATPWTVTYQAPPSMGFSRQEYWSVLPFPSPGDLPDPGIEQVSPTFQADALTSEPPGKPKIPAGFP